MQIFPSRTEFIKIGPISITYYAILIVLGASVVYFLSRRNTRKIKYPDFYLDDLFMDVLIVGVVGARLWYCIFYDFNYFFSNPLRILEIYKGGLAIHGGIIFGVSYAYYYAKRKGVSFLKIIDQILPNVLIAQAIGRWGNFINQEAYGYEVTENFFNGILGFIKEGMYINGKYYFPTFIVESGLNILGFLIIALVLKKYVFRRGQMTYAYLLWYGAVRFFIEIYRSDALLIGSFKIAQLISILFILIGLVGYFGCFDKLFKKSKPTILFDLDGTLIDTEKGIIKTFEELFKEEGKIEEFDQYKRKEVIGPSLYELFPKYFKGKDVEELILRYRKINEEIFESYNKIMDNSYYILKYLKDNNYNVGIVSSKMHQAILDNLKIYNIDKFIDIIIGVDDVSNVKPDPEGINKAVKIMKWNRDELIYVGDSYNDIIAAKNANAYSVGYYFNPDRKIDLDSANANIYIDDLKDIVDIVNKDIHFTSDLK